MLGVKVHASSDALTVRGCNMHKDHAPVTVHLNWPNGRILAVFSVPNMADHISDQRVYVKIRSKLGCSATEIHEDLQKVYGENGQQYSEVTRWIQWFKDGHELVEGKEWPGQPVTATSEKEWAVHVIKELKEKDARFTLHELAHQYQESHRHRSKEH